MYVDSFFDRRGDKIKVAERINGKRILRELKPVYEFYAEDPNGTIATVTGELATKYTFNSNKEMKAKLSMFKVSGIKTFESDVNVLHKTLDRAYKGEAAPKLHVAFFDIETDFDKIRGYAPVDDTFNKVTGISMYLTWCSRLVNLVLKPSEMSIAEAERIVATFDNHEGEVYLFLDEVKMFNRFFELIEDADVMSGWNSQAYDVPYLTNRIERTMSKADTARFCLWNEAPKPRTFENFGNDVPTYDYVGRIHMDYLDLYKKHTYQEMQSYKLDYIGEITTGEKKVEYHGTLDNLYNNEFDKFIEYGLQDSKLLKLIDDKKDFISLHNKMAHDECVNISTTMGSVALIDTAIINEIHSWGEVVFDKMKKPEPEHGAAGAWVADPKIGLHDGIGCVDFASLYPSVLRSLKMSTESIIGQVRQTYTDAELDKRIKAQELKYKGKNFEANWAEAWHGLFACLEHTMIIDKTNDILTIDLEDGSVVEMTAADINEFIFHKDSTIVISANGTLFDRSKRGAIPSILTRWYAERKKMKKASFDYQSLGSVGLDIPEDILGEFE